MRRDPPFSIVKQILLAKLRMVAMTWGEGISRLLPLDGSFIALWEASRVIATDDYA